MAAARDKMPDGAVGAPGASSPPPGARAAEAEGSRSSLRPPPPQRPGTGLAATARVASAAFVHEKLTPLYFPNFFCSFLTGLGCPNCIDYFTSQGLQNIYHLQNLSIEVNALGSSVLTTCFYQRLIGRARTKLL